MPPSPESQDYAWFSGLKDSDFGLTGHSLIYFIVGLFSGVGTITVLFLYCKWLWDRRQDRIRNRRNNNNNNVVQAAPAAAASPPPPPRGLDPEIINALPVTIYHHRSLGEGGGGDASSSNSCSSNDEFDGFTDETECCICLAAFEDEDKVKVIPKCKHCFHGECVDRWLTAQTSCPLCRASLEEVEDESSPSSSTADTASTDAVAADDIDANDDDDDVDTTTTVVVVATTAVAIDNLVSIAID